MANTLIWRHLPDDMLFKVMSFHEVTDRDFGRLCDERKFELLHMLKRLRVPVFKDKRLLIARFQAACSVKSSLPLLEFLSCFLTADDMRANDNDAFQRAYAVRHKMALEFLALFLTPEDMTPDSNYAFRMACQPVQFNIVELFSDAGEAAFDARMQYYQDQYEKRAKQRQQDQQQFLEEQRHREQQQYRDQQQQDILHRLIELLTSNPRTNDHPMWGPLQRNSRHRSTRRRGR